MGITQEAAMWLVGFWIVLIAIGWSLNQLRKWLNKKLNKHGINLGKKDDDGQK